MQKLWALAAAVIGVLLAVLLVPHPDTGGSVNLTRGGGVTVPAVPRPAQELEDIATPVPPKRGKRAKAGVRAKLGKRPKLSPPGGRIGLPSMVVGQARSQPASIFAGKATAPWTLVRRNLVRSENPDAKAFANEVNQIIQELREVRRDPSLHDFAGLESTQRDLQGRLRASSFKEDTEIANALDRLDLIFSEYHEKSKKEQ